MKKLLALIGATLVIATACGPSTTSTAPSAPADSPAPGESTAPGVSTAPSPSAAGDETAPITVWIDGTREAAVEAFKTANPDKAALINVELVDRKLFPAKVLLFNNIGKGWPDVVFAEPEIVSQVSDASRDFPLDLKPWVAQDILDQFAPGANAPCTLPDGRLVCLRNDLAQNVLWYNKPLMDKFGYEVPVTWEDFAALGERIATENPGYVIGAFGDGQALNSYFWPSQCPTGQSRGPNTVYINVLAPECERVVKMFDRLIEIGVVTKVGPFDPAFIKLANEDKLLMMEVANWYGEYVFGGKPDSTYYKEAKGQLGIALPLKWQDEDQAWTGAQGGAAWTVSRHTANPKLATDFVTFVTTANEYHGTGPTFPAYAPAAEVWAKTVAGNKVYAMDPIPVMKESAALVDPLWENVRYDRPALFTTVVIGALTEGNTIASAMQAFQDQLVSLAEAAGYEVVTQP